MRDNVIKYNDEGGGEQDTQAYDMSALRNLYDFPEAKGSDAGPRTSARCPIGPGRRRRRWRVRDRLRIRDRIRLHFCGGSGRAGNEPPADFSLFKGYIRKKVEQADADLSVPPYDSFQTYAFEGSSSPALSLSSIHTLSTASEQDFSYLSDWGPRFRQLAGYYAPANPGGRLLAGDCRRRRHLITQRDLYTPKPPTTPTPLTAVSSSSYSYSSSLAASSTHPRSSVRTGPL
ncbi:Cadherin-22 [Merluccius polli]|uniref:Cadherin-22 n=1 Tax=Merluccius polli TaxID=89951 RepID=A0AA47PB87_MERPO|nr:Cadherin-22 [Merluccius polli]